ncbi:MAG TPA: MFS transporter [Devosia sp.]|uniref:MFS transporter n=1 Tax=Devosia sp. TaxID=1871048 RepID=UPI002DDDB8A5|nr:MFS transporter [Devosia sp.]HEV2515693.1 MFS transporter [Devosia sp.]
MGMVRSAQWLPFLLFGLIAGVIADRVQRKHLLVGTDISSSILIFLIAGLAIGGVLTVPVLMVLVFALGLVTVLNGGTHQSFVADLLPAHLLTKGNVVLSQSYTVAQTLGPVIGGLLVRLVGAPFTMVANAISYALSALLMLRVPDVDSQRVPTRQSVLSDLREGFSYVYRHPTLAPYALSLHTWFIGNSVAGTVFVFRAASIGLDSATIGLTLACAGVAGLLGAAMAEKTATWLGLGVVVAVSDFCTGLGWLLIAIAPVGDTALWVICAGQVLYGVGFGATGPLSGSFRNAVTPPQLRGRMNTTIRSFNWGLMAVAAPLGGWLAYAFGDRVALGIGGAIILISAAALASSRFRKAVMPGAERPASVAPD